jgi:hypothetical protein
VDRAATGWMQPHVGKPESTVRTKITTWGEPPQERKIGTDELRVPIIGWGSAEGSVSGS